ncbi:hypothetical protein [Collimonas arenae]|uniref:hypothetical protein n=1 Tax=Collimonas arenae TaxID=279058 RepID=UPI000570B299|nr:hypothetical protein [Collimonas arenae]
MTEIKSQAVLSEHYDGAGTRAAKMSRSRMRNRLAIAAAISICLLSLGYIYFDAAVEFGQGLFWMLIYTWPITGLPLLLGILVLVAIGFQRLTGLSFIKNAVWVFATVLFIVLVAFA